MSSPPRQNRQSQSVQFNSVPTTHEYPVFGEDPPIVVQGRYQPPPAPRLSARSLPSTPQAGLSTLPTDDLSPTVPPLQSDDVQSNTTSTIHTPSMASRSPDAASSSMKFRPRTPPETSVEGASPSTPTSVTTTNSASPRSPTLSTSASDLHPQLQRFPLIWSIRQERFTNVARADFLRMHAFSSGRKSCTLHFQGVHPSDSWDVAVGPRRDGHSLTVEDVLSRIDRELYKQDDGNGFYDNHPRLGEARCERLSRLYGEEDAVGNVLRGIDFFSEQEHQLFYGLEEMPTSGSGGVRYRVLLGPAQGADGMR